MENMQNFGPESLMLVAGALLSLGFAYVPGLAEAYEKLSSVLKVSIMGGLMLLAAVAIFGLSCYTAAPYAGLPVCEAGLIWRLGEVLALALLGLAGNQGVYLAGVRPFQNGRVPYRDEEPW